MSGRRPWIEAEVATLRRLYADTLTSDIARQLGRTEKQVYAKAHKLGLLKSLAFIAQTARERALRPGHRGAGHRFQPGHVTWNKGLAGSTGLHENTRRHWFATGHMPQTWRPIGSTRIVDGIVQRKVAETGYSPRDYVPVHRLVWEAEHGPVPAGYVVVFRPGRKTTDPALITLDALELVSRAELMARNSVHRLPKPVADAVQLLGALQRQINRRTKDATT